MGQRGGGAMSGTQGPRLRVGTETKEPLAGAVALLRLLAVLFLITNLLAAIVAAVTVACLRRWRKVRAWWVLLVGVGGLLDALLWVTQGPASVRWALEVWPVVFDAVGISLAAGV